MGIIKKNLPEAIWGSTFTDKDGKLMVTITTEFVKLQQLYSSKDVRTITDHENKQIGFVLSAETEIEKLIKDEVDR